MPHHHRREFKMGTLVDTLSDIGVDENEFINLNYQDSAQVWHITDNYIAEALVETATASRLAELLVRKDLTVLSRWDENILVEMRANGLLNAYERDDSFESYLTQTIQEEAYEYDLLSVATEKYDYKRGVCEVTANLKIPVKEVLALGDEADSVFLGWNISVRTKAGLLTLE